MKKAIALAEAIAYRIGKKTTLVINNNQVFIFLVSLANVEQPLLVLTQSFFY